MTTAMPMGAKAVAADVGMDLESLHPHIVQILLELAGVGMKIPQASLVKGDPGVAEGTDHAASRMHRGSIGWGGGGLSVDELTREWFLR
jgi:hypothetical protein